jgi:hypothetical protein
VYYSLAGGRFVQLLVFHHGHYSTHATGSPWDIAFAFNVAYSTIHAKKYDVVGAINNVLRDNIRFPTTEAELQRSADGFARIAQGKGSVIPDVVAAVDSVVIERKKPIASREKNVAGQYCRKGCFATVMLAFVDASSRFLSISTVCAASSHDSTLYACSTVGKKILSGALGPKWTIVGDDAFTCCGNIITPFAKHTLNSRQRNYNYFCSLVRQVVECAFGRWKQKWGILWRPLLVDANNIKSVVECTCRLHNYCIDQNCQDTAFVPPLQDLWWQRTASPKVMAAGRAPPTPVAVMQPLWANAELAQAALGSSQFPNTHTRREAAVRMVEMSGLVAPDASGKWTRDMINAKRVGEPGGLSAWRVV